MPMPINFQEINPLTFSHSVEHRKKDLKTLFVPVEKMKDVQEGRRIKMDIPQTSGVYFFRNNAKKILYIGKAANLRSRLYSYFAQSASLDAAKRQMLLEAHHITWHETASEIEALLLEASLIKKHLPPYNIVMRDDKQYLFVGFTKEPFPRIVFTHQPVAFAQTQKSKLKNKNCNSKIKTDFVGPFTEAGAVKQLLRSLRKAFPYCMCKKPHIRSCQFSELGLCVGVCCLKTPNTSNEVEPRNIIKRRYKKNIRYIKNILAGRQKQLLSHLQTDMRTASKREEFEAAAYFRNQAHALTRIFAHRPLLKKDYISENQKGLHELRMLLGLAAYPKRIEGYDISNIQGNFAVGSMVVFSEGAADKNAYRKFKIRTVEGANDTAMMREVLERRLRHKEWPLPDVLLIDGGRPQLNAAFNIITRLNLVNCIVVSIAKREEELYVPRRKTPFKLKEMPVSLLYLLQQIRDEAHRSAISYYRKRHRAAQI